MILKVLAFGIAKDIIGKQKISLEVEGIITAKQFREILCSKYSKLNTLPGFLLAVNASYAKKNTRLKNNDEIAIIPPTNGG